MRFLVLVAALAAHLFAGVAQAQPVGSARVEGFIPMYWDSATDRLFMEVPELGEDVLYYVSTAHGVGSVELGLDRGVTRQSVVRFERAGPKVHVVEQNLSYRSTSASDALARNVHESFAVSVLAALPIDSEDGGRIVVDASSLFFRDASDVRGRLRDRGQGSFRLDRERSAFFAERTSAFPENTEVEVTLTFASDDPGPLVRGITPDGRSLTVRVHHSFLRAPTGYRPRRADPRIGVGSIMFKDYASGFDRDPEVRWIRRWRLEKRDAGAAMSEPIRPIVYYLDDAIPEPVRSAMRDGVLWWNRAFEAAGYRNAIEVRDPPPGMDPMDVRYAYILWVNRDERGFSSGGGITDPRTGEILSATTRMDSHRIRTIGHYWQSYQMTDESGFGDDCGMLLPSLASFLPPQAAAGGQTSIDEFVLARQAVLSAHEIGHTLGFGHNWNSSINGRASVMEYPTPRVDVRSDGTIDLSQAFETNVGAYDEFMARYAYTEFESSEEEGLESIIDEMRDAGVLFTPSTDPRWSWYDDLASPAEYLRLTADAREVILDHFGPGILREGEPIGELRDMRLWMSYLHHRWAIEHAIDFIGGMYHNRVVKGDDLSSIPPTEIVPASTQRELLGLLMKTLEPVNLELPERILQYLTPSPYDNLEDMSGNYAFDQLRAARILSAMVLEVLLEPGRAARLVAFAERQDGALTLPEVLDAVLQQSWHAESDVGPRHGSLRRVTQRVALDAMMILGAHPDATPDVRAVVMQTLVGLKGSIEDRTDQDPVTEAHLRQSERDIERYLEDPEAVAPASAAPSWGGRPRSRFPLAPGPPLGGGRIP